MRNSIEMCTHTHTPIMYNENNLLFLYTRFVSGFLSFSSVQVSWVLSTLNLNVGLYAFEFSAEPRITIQLTLHMKECTASERTRNANDYFMIMNFVRMCGFYDFFRSLENAFIRCPLNIVVSCCCFLS